MSPSPQLAPPGSSSYTSNTMSVGDGTWDTSRNTFLLPNLVGLNLATTQYNGMGNRFREMPGYHNLIRAHGTIAAITFLLIVPSAIMIVRFYGRNPRAALRYHIWLQILTILLATVVFVLGWMAVGPARKLTNPHHAIGLTIYVLVWVQAIGGWWVHHREKAKRRLYAPLKVMFHHWIGRAVALLGLAQIPLGLALYGSPVFLFVLYALAAFALVMIYFILTYIQERRGGSDYDSRYSYGTGSVLDDRRHRRTSGGRAGNVVKGALAGAGFLWLLDRIRGRKSRKETEGPEVVGSRRHSGSYIEDEKYSQYSHDDGRGGVWEDRLFRIAAPIGLAGLLARYLDRRHRDDDSDTGSYGPPLGEPAPIHDGRYDGPAPGPLPAHQHPLNQPLPPGQLPPGQLPPGQFPPNQLPPPGPFPPGQRPPFRRPGSPSSYTQSSFVSASGQRREGHGLRVGLATLGVLGLARSVWNKRKERKENRRYEEEQDARMHGNHLTGDGRPLRHHPPGESTLTSDTSSIGARPHNAHGVPPIPPAGVYPSAAAAVGGSRAGSRRHDRDTADELPLGGIPRHGQVAMPAIPPDRHGGLFHDDSSGSEVYIGEDGRNHWRHHAGHHAAAAAGVSGSSAGLAAAEVGHSRRGSRDRREDVTAVRPPSARRDASNRRNSNSAGEDSRADSTPVSVKVKMHNDGRHVTLRRLPQAEAAAEREARRHSRDPSGRRRGGSASTLSGTDGSTDRFRRNQLAERQQAEAMRIESERLAEARQQAQAQANPNIPPNVPAPPPIPESSSGLRPPGPASVGSPGTYDGNTTDLSADYANNRRRRRAERAQAKQAREQKRVEFE